MISIERVNKSKKDWTKKLPFNFHVLTISSATKRNILNTSESMTQKPATLKNIRATMVEWNSRYIYLQDNAVAESIVYKVTITPITKKNKVGLIFKKTTIKPYKHKSI